MRSVIGAVLVGVVLSVAAAAPAHAYDFGKEWGTR
jgi:hypothetical protein